MWPNPQISADLVTFTEEIFNGKLQRLVSKDIISSKWSLDSCTFTIMKAFFPKNSSKWVFDWRFLKKAYVTKA